MHRNELYRRNQNTAEQDLSPYRPTRDLFTADRRQLYGAILKDGGEPYGAELNGLSLSGAMPGVSPFRIRRLFSFCGAKRLLRRREPKLNAASQMVYWMKELTEITPLDFIFSQQDRNHSIDFR